MQVMTLPKDSTTGLPLSEKEILKLLNEKNTSDPPVLAANDSTQTPASIRTVMGVYSYFLLSRKSFIKKCQINIVCLVWINHDPPSRINL